MFSPSRTSLLLILCLSALSHSDNYAQGGKAAPARIRFLRGHTSAVIQGKLRGAQQSEYTIGAREGQKLNVKLIDAPAGSLSIKVMDSDDHELQLEDAGKQQWSLTLPKTSDFLILVVRSPGKAGLSRYKMTVKIE